jgi:cation-transporting ATPase E
MVCADKTGTLTENGMRVAGLEDKGRINNVADVLASMAADDTRPNASIRAVAEAFVRRH